MRLRLLIVCSTLAACTTYTPRPGELTAKLRFVTYTAAISDIHVHDMAACPVSKRLFFKNISGFPKLSSSRIGMRGTTDQDAEDSTELLIPAGRRLPLVVGSFSPGNQFAKGYVCSIGISFEPKPDAEYEIQYRYEHHRCSARLFELTETTGGARRSGVENARSFRAKAGMDLCPYQ